MGLEKCDYIEESIFEEDRLQVVLTLADLKNTSQNQIVNLHGDSRGYFVVILLYWIKKILSGSIDRSRTTATSIVMPIVKVSKDLGDIAAFNRRTVGINHPNN